MMNSEYLKWYRSHTGHSEMKQQAKKEIEQLREQLAKANERVALLERVETIFNEAPELTFEDAKTTFSSELNKFALEQKIEALECARNTLSLHGLGDTGAAGELDDEIEQLRKEQDDASSTS